MMPKFRQKIKSEVSYKNHNLTGGFLGNQNLSLHFVR